MKKGMMEEKKMKERGGLKWSFSLSLSRVEVQHKRDCCESANHLRSFFASRIERVELEIIFLYFCLKVTSMPVGKVLCRFTHKLRSIYLKPRRLLRFEEGD